MAKHKKRKRWTKRRDSIPAEEPTPVSASCAEIAPSGPARSSPVAARWRWLSPQIVAPCLLLAVGLVAYHNSLTGPFIFDDYNSITNNPYIRKLWPLTDAMSWPRLSTVSGRPVVALSLAINYAFGQFEVRGYHALNVALHLLTGLLLLGVARRTLQSRSLVGRYTRQAPWLALAVALIWVVHPLLTEGVDYVIQRTEVLMGLFMLLTLYCVIRGSSSAARGGWYVAAVFACALGMGSKEVMVVAPVIVLLYDRAFLSTSFRDALHRRWGLYAGLAGTWLVLFRLQAGAHPEVSATSMTPWAYGTTQLGVIAHYLRLSLWPQPLVVDYDDWPIARTVADVLPGAVVVVALLGVTLWAARRHPRWSFLGAWFFLILAPSSSVLPLAAEIAAERRMYVPLAAVVALAVVGGYEILGHVFRRFRHGEALRAAAGVCMVVIATGVLGLGTIRRNEDYRSLISIWGDTVAKRPNNSRAQNNLGTAYHMAGQLEEARKHYAEAVRVKPGFAVAQTNLAVVLVKQGKLAEAIAHFNQSLAARASLSVHANTRKQLAWALARHGRIEDAIADYREAVRLAPGDADALTSLADLLRRQGRLDEAVEAYSRALGIRPNQASTHVSLGQTLASQGKIADATRHFEAALRLDPNHPQARRALADLRNGVTRATP